MFKIRWFCSLMNKYHILTQISAAELPPLLHKAGHAVFFGIGGRNYGTNVDTSPILSLNMALRVCCLSQIVNDYGALGNAELLRRFGFVESIINPHDCCQLPVSALLESALDIRRAQGGTKQRSCVLWQFCNLGW